MSSPSTIGLWSPRRAVLISAIALAAIAVTPLGPDVLRAAAWLAILVLASGSIGLIMHRRFGLDDPADEPALILTVSMALGLGLLGFVLLGIGLVGALTAPVVGALFALTLGAG